MKNYLPSDKVNIDEVGHKGHHSIILIRKYQKNHKINGLIQQRLITRNIETKSRTGQMSNIREGWGGGGLVGSG